MPSLHLLKPAMSTVPVRITASPGDPVTSVVLHVDSVLVPLQNNVAELSLVSPASHILVWHFTGPEGATLGVLVESGGKPVLQIKKSRIPAGEGAGAGIAKFVLPGA